MKIKLICLFVLVLFLFSFKPIELVNWKLDTNHSGLGFSILHLNISDLKGTVKMTKASLSVPNADFTEATISMEADITTIDTDNDKRDAHLKTADFFDAEKYPTLTFQSNSCKKNKGDEYTITGNLSLHGITHPVNLIAVFKTGINPSNDKPIAACKVTGTIKRSDFNISTATPAQILSDEVNIEANLEFSKE
jgi:polyisoprenoid-binding protein YceI